MAKPSSGSMVARNINVTYSMVRRGNKGRSRYGAGENDILIRMTITHKARNLRLGTFTLTQIESLLGKTDSNFIKLKTLASESAKGLDGDRSSSKTNSVLTSTIANTKLVAWAKTFPDSAPYMMMYSKLT